MSEEEYMTGFEWAKLPEYSHIIFLDYGGWLGGANEFYNLKISEEGFQRRVKDSFIYLKVAEDDTSK